MPSQGRTSIRHSSTGRSGSHHNRASYNHGYTPVHGYSHGITHQPTHGTTYAAPLDHSHRVSSPYRTGRLLDALDTNNDGVVSLGEQYQAGITPGQLHNAITGHRPHQSISYVGHHGGLNTSHHGYGGGHVSHHNVTKRIVISPGGTRREEGGDGHHYQAYGGHHNLNRSRHASPRRGSITREYATDRPRSPHRGGKTLGRGGDIKLTIESAKFAKDADAWGKQDPYIRFTYKGKREQTRALQGAGKKAKWDQVFTLADVGSATGDLRLEAVDEDTLADDWIGATDRLPYSDLLENPGRPQKRKLALRDKSGKEVGQLKFTTVYNGAGAINGDDTYEYERTVYETVYDQQPYYEHRDISYDQGHHGRLNSSRVHHHHSPRVIRADDYHHSPVVHHRQPVVHHAQPVHHREPARHSISHSPNRSVIHPSTRPSIHAHQPIVHHQPISHHQPIVHHQPITHHQPIVHHQPIAHHQPVVHHQPITHHQPIVHHQPITHQQPIAHQPIHRDQPRRSISPAPVHSVQPTVRPHQIDGNRAPTSHTQPVYNNRAQPVHDNRAQPVHDNRAQPVYNNRAQPVHDNRVPVTRNGQPVTRLQ